MNYPPQVFDRTFCIEGSLPSPPYELSFTLGVSRMPHHRDLYDNFRPDMPAIIGPLTIYAHASGDWVVRLGDQSETVPASLGSELSIKMSATESQISVCCNEISETMLELKTEQSKPNSQIKFGRGFLERTFEGTLTNLSVRRPDNTPVEMIFNKQPIEPKFQYQIQPIHTKFFAFFSENLPPSITDVLEIGSDGEALVSHVFAKEFDCNVTASNFDTNFAPGIQSSRIKHSVEDGRHLTFQDESFDAIITVNTFEHIQNLSLALLEMYRVLRPGGYVATIFGPIWTSQQGHHLWAQDGDDIVSFWDTSKRNPVEDFEHLLLPPHVLRDRLEQRGEKEGMVLAILNAIYARDDINRMCHREYLDTFSESPFEIVLCEPHNQSSIESNILRELEARWGPSSDYSVTSLRLILRKPLRG